MAFDIQALTDAARCAECLSPNQKQNVLLYLLNGILENGTGGGGGGGVDCLHNLLSVIHPDTLPSAVSRGSLIVGNATPLWAELAIGAAGTVLTSDGTDASWSTPASAGTVTSFSAGNLAPLFTTSVATASTTPALTFSLSTQAANLVFAGPASGVAAGPTFRSLVALDLPATAVVPATYGSATQVGQFTVDQQGRITLAANVAITYPGSFSGFAAPSALVGLSAIAGIATTAIRSDGAPALDQSIVPTWTGAHTWTPPVNTTPITVSGYSLTGANAQSLLNLSGTWDTSGSPTAILVNITSTAVGSAALLLDIQKDTISRFRVSRTGFATFTRQEADTSSGGIAMNKRGTTGDATAAIANASSITGIEFNGWDGAAYGLGANIRAIATETWTAAGHGTSLVFSMSANGSILTPIKFTLTSTAFAFSPHGVAAGNTSEMRFIELAAGGTNYTGFKAPDAMAASEIYVLPDAAPAANRFLRAGAVAAGVSTLSWAQVSLTADVTGILPVANGGSGTSTAFTAGSVIFAGAAGVFAQDNANFFWDDANNWLGLGIAVPLARLHIVSSAAATIVEIVKAAAAQSANLTEWQSSAGVANTVINAAGNISIPTTTSSTVGVVFQGPDRFLHSFGGGNLFLGLVAGNFTMTGMFNVGIGTLALAANTTGDSNLAVGYASLYKNTTGFQNTAFGTQTLQANVDGDSNTACGNGALFFNVSGNENTGVGSEALALATGSRNVALGYAAGINLTTGSSNICIGYNINSPTATNSNTLTLGNLIFGAGVNGTGTTLSTGGVGIRVITPSAYLHLCAGTTAASTAPLKFNTGTSMTAAESGAVEFTTDDLFFTITTGAARKRLLMADATAGLTSGKMPIATTNGRLIDLTASAAYTPTNVTTDRSYDANATTTDELADVLGTIIADLQTKGILG